MHFYKKKGKQHISTTGDLIMTKNETLVSCSSKSALPVLINGGDCAYVRKGNRIRATITALTFIWSK